MAVIDHRNKTLLQEGEPFVVRNYRNCKLVQMTDGYRYGSTRYEYESVGNHILAIPAIIN